MLANLIWKGIFVHFIADSTKEDYSFNWSDIAWLHKFRVNHGCKLQLADLDLFLSKKAAWTVGQTFAFVLIHTIKMICLLSIPVPQHVGLEDERKSLLNDLLLILSTKILPENMVENMFCISRRCKLRALWLNIIKCTQH